MNIGDLNTTGFAVSTGTNTLYHTGTGQRLTFPTGTSGVWGTNYAIRRYWKINTAVTSTSSAIEISYPFTAWDSSDVNGSLSSATIPMTKYQLYKVTPVIDPNPLNGLPSATAANVTIFGNASASSTTKWALSKVGTTAFASFKTTTPGGGGSLFLSSNYMVGISELNSGNEIDIYPNPTTNTWKVKTGANTGTLTVQVFHTNGAIMFTGNMDAESILEIDGHNFPAGLYYYRIITGSSTLTGALIKQ